MLKDIDTSTEPTPDRQRLLLRDQNNPVVLAIGQISQRYAFAAQVQQPGVADKLQQLQQSLEGDDLPTWDDLQQHIQSIVAMSPNELDGRTPIQTP